MKLTEEQQRVSDIREGQHVAAAGPGAGKTRTLVERVKALLNEGEKPQRILVVTFTKAAANEFMERLGDAKVDVRTWHSWGFGLLKQYKIAKTVVTNPTGVLRRIWAQQRLPEEEPTESSPGFTPEVLAREIARTKLQGNFAPGPSHWPTQWRDIYSLYEQELNKEKGADFGDMLLKSENLLRTDGAVLSKIHKKYDHLMVDETQDNNGLQWRLVNLISPGMKSTVVVGDSRQSIFAFAGAQPQQLVNFSRSASVHSITVNWRSTPQVVAVCNQLMNHADQSKLVGEAFRPSEIAKAGPEPKAIETEDPSHQGDMVAQAIQSELEDGISPSEIACVYRTRRCSMYLSRALLKAGIPHVIRGGQSFFELRHIRTVLAYIRVAFNRDDKTGSALKATYNTPKRYLGPKTLGLPPGAKAVWPMVDDIQVQYKARYRWNEYLDALEAVRNTEDPEAAIRLILSLKSAGRGEKHTLADELIGKIGEEADNGKLEEDWETLISLAREYEDMTSFLDEVDRLSGVASVDPNQEEVPKEAVALMTIHRCKGLEYSAVHLTNACEGMLPHALAISSEDEKKRIEGIEEERRLAFVAMSRAKERLTCWYYTRDEQERGTTKSRFLSEAGL